MTDSITRQGAPIPFYGHQEGEIAVAVATSDHVNHPFHEGYVLVTTALGSLARSSDCADPAKGGNLCYVAALPVGKAIDLAEKLLGAISTAINSGGNRAAIRSRLLAEVVPESLRAEFRDALTAAIDAPRLDARREPEIVDADVLPEITGGGVIALLRTSAGEWGVGYMTSMTADAELVDDDGYAPEWFDGADAEREARTLYAEERGKAICECGAEVYRELIETDDDGIRLCPPCAALARVGQ